jgi:allantoin racemase
MKLLLVNLNTSKTITDKMRDVVVRVKRPDTEVEVVCPYGGPTAIDSSYDEAYAVPAMLEVVRKANKGNFDGIILGCFCDAGVEAAREISDIPVIAMEEATLALAITLGNKFSIMTEKQPRVAMKELHIRRAGLLDRLASIRPLGLSVTELDKKPEETKEKGLSLAKKMIDRDGAEVIIMGCAAMAGYTDSIEQKLHVPVLDPTKVAFKWAEMVVDLGLAHSKVGLYHTPKAGNVPKNIVTHFTGD